MKSPFKFLDAYTLKDKDVFFGRDKEVEALYEMVFRTPLLLVYGLSGTGKTSLVQCGLASRFDGPEWYPFFVRRRDNINDSLRAALRQAIAEPMEGAALPELVGEVFEEYLSPVYLIFDQFEELFILGSPAEQAAFAEDIKALLAAELPCKVLFIIREEYLGQLYPLERAIPTLFDFRLRVEPMSNTRVREVLRASFEKFNISLEAPPEERLQEIIDNVSAGRSGIQLPYLQVYLDQLWREDLERTYSLPPAPSKGGGERALPKTNSEQQITDSWPPLEFTRQEIQSFSRIENVLDKFLQQQREELQEQLEKGYAGVPEQAVRQVLDVFVTAEGTKRPVNFEREEEGNILLEENVLKLLPEMPAGALTACLEALEQRRLLRFAGQNIELAHDSLAALIDEQRTDEQRQLNEIRLRIAGAYREWERTEKQEYLTRRQLLSIEELLPKVPLEPHLRQFVQDSYAHNDAVEEAQRQREREELEKERRLRGEAETAQQQAETAKQEAEENAERAAANARQARQRTRWALAAFLVAILFVVGTFVLWRQSQNLAGDLEVQGEKLANNVAELQNKETALQRALTNAQNAKDTAEARRIEAEISESKAKQQTQIAEQAKADLETYAKEAMPVLIADIKNLILALQYDRALARCKTAWNLDKEQPQLPLFFQELAYFFTESGAFDKAENALAHISRKPARLSSQPAQRRKELLAVIERIDTKYLKDTLERRYYPEMIAVKGGSFCMSRDHRIKGDCDTSETKVILDDFKLGKTEVTVWQYNLYCAGSGQDSLERIRDELPWELQGNHPGVKVSWYDAARYANWINRQMGHDTVYNFVRQIDEDNWEVSLNEKVKDAFRLPTEAEWEYAARGGIQQDTFLYSGDSDLDSVAWHYYNSNGRTHPVAQKKPNSLKLYDMSGNVWEWCWDWYDELETGVISNPHGPDSGSGRLVRGGSWLNLIDWDYEVTYRDRDDPNYRYYYDGFRLAQD